MIPSPSGASETCSECGTIYDGHYVDVSDYVPPVGDGCEHCDPEFDVCPNDNLPKLVRIAMRRQMKEKS